MPPPFGGFENKTNGGGGIEANLLTARVARVQGIETNNNRLTFKTPDFTENSLSFRVCP